LFLILIFDNGQAIEEDKIRVQQAKLAKAQKEAEYQVEYLFVKC
jgi:hypothetical protein